MSIDKLVLGMALAFSVSAHAGEDPNWVQISHVKAARGEFSYDFKRHSCALPSATNDIIICLERVVNSATNTTALDWVATRAPMCKDGMGKVTTISLDGKTVLATDDAVTSAGTVASHEFEFLCYLLENKDKGPIT
jgi:hypothetical protein